MRKEDLVTGKDYALGTRREPNLIRGTYLGSRNTLHEFRIAATGRHELIPGYRIQMLWEVWEQILAELERANAIMKGEKK